MQIIMLSLRKEAEDIFVYAVLVTFYVGLQNSAYFAFNKQIELDLLER